MFSNYIADVNSFLNFLKKVIAMAIHYFLYDKFIFFILLIPIAFACLYIIFDFIFDISELFSEIKVNNTFLYKGMKQYEKNQREQRKMEEKQQKIAEKQRYNTVNSHIKNSNDNYYKAMEKSYFASKSKPERVPHPELDIEYEDD